MATPNDQNWTRIWLLPLSILMGAGISVLVLSYWLDAGNVITLWDRLIHPNPTAGQDALGGAAEVISAVLGIAITVVAIVVELAANRYTHRITELFVSEPINFLVTGFFVISALQAVFVGLTFETLPTGELGFVPRWGIVVSMSMLALCLLLLLPYFAFVFAFLSPIAIVHRIQRHTLKVIGSSARRSVSDRQAEAVRGIEQLADVGLNAMEHKDKGVSMASVDALQAMVLDYQALRPALSDQWYAVDGELAHNPDFVSMSPGVLDAVTARRIWFEMKILRKYQTLYNEALNKMRDINYLIAINTRHIAEAALNAHNKELFDVVVKFFNTYLRATVNARDVRTAYNVLNQYRLLAEGALLYEKGERAIEVARYFKYYGQVSFSAKLPFILETVAYDLCALNEMAFDVKSPATDALLKLFLEVDKESETDVQEASLRGVRKAQVKLATYYLMKGDEARAREVFRDMRNERHERLASIRDELSGVESSEFWEISDRGVNFDYLEPARKRQLHVFFGWFPDLRPARQSVAAQELVPPAVQVGMHSREHVLSGPGVGQDPGRTPVRVPHADD